MITIRELTFIYKIRYTFQICHIGENACLSTIQKSLDIRYTCIHDLLNFYVKILFSKVMVV